MSTAWVLIQADTGSLKDVYVRLLGMDSVSETHVVYGEYDLVARIDFTDEVEVGRISANTSGQSYMPAVVVPIPIIAPVQGTACDSLGDQLLKYLSAKL